MIWLLIYFDHRKRILWQPEWSSDISQWIHKIGFLIWMNLDALELVWMPLSGAEHPGANSQAWFLDLQQNPDPVVLMLGDLTISHPLSSPLFVDSCTDHINIQLITKIKSYKFKYEAIPETPQILNSTSSVLSLNSSGMCAQILLNFSLSLADTSAFPFQTSVDLVFPRVPALSKSFYLISLVLYSFQS